MDKKDDLDTLMERVQANEDMKSHLPTHFNLSFLSYFLKDNDGNVDDAYQQVMDYSNWRKEQNVGILDLEMVRKELELGKLFILPITGDPKFDVLVVFKSKMHLPSMSPTIEFIRSFVYVIEAFLCEEKEHPGFIVINDMEGIGYANFDFSILNAFSGLQKCMPVLPGKILIFNPPFIFRMLWNVAYPFLSEAVSKLIEVIYTKDGVLKLYISPPNLPIEYGGEKKLHNSEWLIHLPTPSPSTPLPISP